MTITNQDLIDAAKAIGIEVEYRESLDALYHIDGIIQWAPYFYKSQLMDLLWKLGITVDKGVVFVERIYGQHFYDNTFESFAEAIILASAEHYRVGVNKDAQS